MGASPPAPVPPLPPRPAAPAPAGAPASAAPAAASSPAAAPAWTPVGASGRYPGTDLGEVQSAVELASRLVGSQTVPSCFSEHLFRYALGRGRGAQDRCELNALATHLRGDDSLQSLLIELALTPSFRSRPALP